MEDRRKLAALGVACLAGGLAVGYAYVTRVPGHDSLFGGGCPFGFDAIPRLEDSESPGQVPDVRVATVGETATPELAPAPLADLVTAARAGGASDFRVASLFRERIAADPRGGVDEVLALLLDPATLANLGGGPFRDALAEVRDERVVRAVVAALADPDASGAAGAPELLDLLVVHADASAAERLLTVLDDATHPLRTPACERVGAVLGVGDLDRFARVAWSAASARRVYSQLLAFDEARALVALRSVAEDQEEPRGPRAHAAELVGELAPTDETAPFFTRLSAERSPDGAFVALAALRGIARRGERPPSVTEGPLAEEAGRYLHALAESEDPAVWTELARLLVDVPTLHDAELVRGLRARAEDASTADAGLERLLRALEQRG